MIAQVGIKRVTVLIWEDDIWAKIEGHKKGLPKWKIMKRTPGRGNSQQLESSWHIPEISQGGQSNWRRGGKSERWDGENEGLEHRRHYVQNHSKMSYKLWVWDCRGKVFGREESKSCAERGWDFVTPTWGSCCESSTGCIFQITHYFSIKPLSLELAREDL